MGAVIPSFQGLRGSFTPSVYVFVVNDQNTVERRGVKTGEQVGGNSVIEEGLRGDEWVVVTGLLRAIPGAKVTPVRKPAAETAASGQAPPANAQPGKNTP